ncbi:tRNA (adenosine(37)-N6)-threonylcarbamoyltransferase complex transferase subunit TsaD [Acetobacter oeni]|uniref:tRNA N6-adenosine threonylcarbamoyltransferase n=1 Tax=Acetobacter oeni TaxID=304077 RepID=A0A511XNW1_9PROT|nr:tRNA (adenosine(37)-N6)-threonylcarbamoyltransferase complex transferase subunit TsaD [Acetobacter oeni]MBB3882614.1 N6-L-threonylcarbamoyladenine synthase [Acetobacter oeni]NHO18718.1 tRNA (adenosine(37)-N6)-threonylcarbamoyltransferase complex transferase subunit TsaD [Acetobacter oeni]GBR09009.1 O-sialoglycoprotein endopeptidase [Acetobacter oeni LMG 21952]GEN64635.1 tRNA N6-adenosine threonylcarbamoyltransferase [Acetobacter oeni]
MTPDSLDGNAYPVPAATPAGPLLAIESSCDETACAILAPDGTVLAERLVSQEDHVAFGGVVPEIAARAHLALLPDLARKTLESSGLARSDLAAVAASTGPGLIGGLIVGASFGKGLAIALGKPFIAVNHIEAHALSARLPGVFDGHLTFPYLLLLVSGGHCQCLAVEGIGHYRRLGGTIDDAAGEAFDKVAKMLGLGWPGGPALERLAREGNPAAFALPRPLKGRAGCDFSFSGLKTAIARQLEPYGSAPLPRQVAADLAASFQQAVADVIEDRIIHALAMMERPTALVAAGGVAANATLRSRLTALAGSHGLPFVAPPLRLCTDNAVMVGWAALEICREAGRRSLPLPDNRAMRPRPRWPLAEMAERFGAV